MKVDPFNTKMNRKTTQQGLLVIMWKRNMLCTMLIQVSMNLRVDVEQVLLWLIATDILIEGKEHIIKIMERFLMGTFVKHGRIRIK